MENIEKIKEYLKQMLSEKRYIHSVGTMKKAIELAKAYGEDEEKSALTALTHDIAKEMTQEEYYKYAKENNIELSKDDKMCPSVLHGIIGANIVKKKYEFTDEMCRAIYYHTTGITNMTLLAKIVYIADKIEDSRNYEEADTLRKKFKECKTLDEFILYDIDNYTLPKMIKEKKIIHPNTINARNEIIEKMGQF